jgi:hypothetical protein
LLKESWIPVERHKHVVLGILLLAFLVGGLFLAATTLAQTPAANWINSPSLTLDKIRDLSPSELAPYSINGNRDCDNRKIITRPGRLVPLPQTEQSHTSCAVDTAYGAVSASGYLQRQGTTVSGQTQLFTGAPANIIPIPRSTTGLHLISGPPTGVYLQFMPSFESTLKSSAIYDGQVTHTTTPVNTVNFKDRSGQRLPAHTDSLAFSANGQWMVVDVPYVGMARVDLNTYEVLPFADPFNYNIGLNPFIKSAISSDGRWAVLYSLGFTRYRIYDLSTCAAVPNFIVGKVSCQSRDLSAQLGSLGGVGSMRFINNDALQLYASYKDGNTNKTAQFVLRLPGTPIFNYGYLALGDSYTSGEGAFNYKALTDTKDNKCHLSLLSYPYILGRDLNLSRYESVACSGAIIQDVLGVENYNEKHRQAKGKEVKDYDNEILDGFLPGYRAQNRFITEYRPGIITISAVGNDIGFAKKIQRCIEPDTCFASYEDRLEIVREINNQFNRLTNMYSEIKAADPLAKIYAVGYPQVAKLSAGCDMNVHLDGSELGFTESLIDYLNVVVQQAAKHTGIGYADIGDALDGHRLCEPLNSWEVAINGLTAGNDNLDIPFIHGPLGNESYHPTAFGQSLMARKVSEQTAGLTQPMPVADPSALPPIENDSLLILQAPKSGRQIKKINYDGDLSNDILYRNGIWNFVINEVKFGLNPLSTVRAWLNSSPVDLGAYTTDSQGGLNINVPAAQTVPSGFHTLHIYGKNTASEDVDIYKTIYVAVNENDYDGDGIPNSQDSCVVIEPSGTDADKDGVDDACDSFIDQPPLVVLPITTPPVEASPAVESGQALSFNTQLATAPSVQQAESPQEDASTARTDKDASFLDQHNQTVLDVILAASTEGALTQQTIQTASEPVGTQSSSDIPRVAGLSTIAPAQTITESTSLTPTNKSGKPTIILAFIVALLFGVFCLWFIYQRKQI